MLPFIYRTKRSLPRVQPSVYLPTLPILFWGWMVIAAPHPDENATVKRVTLEHALHAVCANHPDAREPRAAIAEATATVAQARAAWHPRGEARLLLGIVNGAKTTDPPDNLPNELAPLFAEGGPDDPLNNLGPFVRGTIRLTQPLFTFGKITHGIEAAEAGVAARKANLRRVCADLRIQVRQLYYGYQLAANLHQSLGRIHQAFEEAVHLAEARLANQDGSITQVEVLKLKIAAQSLARRLVSLQSQKSTALFAFRRALGWSVHSSVYPHSEKLRAEEPVALLPTPDEDASFHPAWQALAAGLTAQQAAVTVASRRLYPDLFLGIFAEASWAPTRDDIQNPFLRDEFNRVRGGPILGLQWDLGFAQHLADKAQAKAKMARHIAKLERARISLPLQQQVAYTTYEEKKTILAICRDNRKNGRNLSLLATSNFQLGLGEPKEVLTSLGLYAKTLGEYYEAVYQYNLAAGKLRELLGARSS